jgi:hypothetical protein
MPCEPLDRASSIGFEPAFLTPPAPGISRGSAASRCETRISPTDTGPSRCRTREARATGRGASLRRAASHLWRVVRENPSDSTHSHERPRPQAFLVIS